LYSNISKEAVISNPDLEEIYELPLRFYEQGLDAYILQRLELVANPPKGMEEWRETVDRFTKAKASIRIAMAGKYLRMGDTYISICEALRHAGAQQGVSVEIEMIDTEEIEQNPKLLKGLKAYQGVLSTPGFGSRGTEGMIEVAGKCIEEDIPYLGICFGSQMLFSAFCRYTLGLKGANSTEIDPDTPYPVVDLLPEQRQVTEKGASMRLGGHTILVKPKTLLFAAYKKKTVRERFRHRYHLMPEFVEKASEKGLVLSATDETGRIVNAIELKDKHWIVGVQCHPEFTSRPDAPNPVYLAFIQAILKQKRVA
jgi:CTP synthase